jgi:hypothetical protein
MTAEMVGLFRVANWELEILGKRGVLIVLWLQRQQLVPY